MFGLSRNGCERRGAARAVLRYAWAVPRIVDHDRRREEIARLAVRVMQQDGAENATIRGIARAGGFSIGVLSHYFRDKDELVGFAFQWVAHQSFTDLDAAVASTPPGLARLRTALEFMVPASSAPSFIRVWLSLWGGAMRSPALACVHRDYYARWRRYLRRYINEAVRRREITAPRSLRNTTDLLTAAVDGYWIGAAFEPRRFPVRRRRALVARLLVTVLGPARAA